MTGERSDLFGTMREPTSRATVELGRLGIPGEPGAAAVRITGADGQEIVLDNLQSLADLCVRLRRGLAHLA